MDEASFNHLFEFKDDIFTYEGFLKAVAKFPAFCDENNSSDYTDEEMCKKELATMFAHFVKETSYNSPWEESANGVDLWRQGLYYTELIGCGDDFPFSANCNYHGSGWVNEAWPNQDG